MTFHTKSVNERQHSMSSLRVSTMVAETLCINGLHVTRRASGGKFTASWQDSLAAFSVITIRKFGSATNQVPITVVILLPWVHYK